jgi:hypothetical protein
MSEYGRLGEFAAESVTGQSQGPAFFQGHSFAKVILRAFRRNPDAKDITVKIPAAGTNAPAYGCQKRKPNVSPGLMASGFMKYKV